MTQARSVHGASAGTIAADLNPSLQRPAPRERGKGGGASVASHRQAVTGKTGFALVQGLDETLGTP